MEHFAEAQGAPRDLFAGGFEGGAALMLAQEVEADAAQEGEVVGGVVFAGAASVLVEDHIEHPVRLILDCLVRADDAAEQFLVRGQAAQIEPHVAAQAARVLPALDVARAGNTPHPRSPPPLASSEVPAGAGPTRSRPLGPPSVRSKA